MAWTAVSGAPRSAYESQTAAGRAAPTDAGDGVALSGVSSITVYVEAESGQTLSGGGTLTAYNYDSVIGAWVPCPESDLTIPASASGKRRISFGDRAIGSPRGRILYGASSVTISGGTNVTVYVICSAGLATEVL